MTKEERLRSGESLMSHAMVFTGYDKRDGEECPNKWRVENRCRRRAANIRSIGGAPHKTLTPLLLETRFWDILLGMSIGRGFRALKGLRAYMIVQRQWYGTV